jgi:hypothetical protein
MALGGTAGLTGAISLLAIGINQVVKHWPELMEMFTDGVKPIQDTATHIKDLEAEIKKLEDKKVKIAVDYADIERAKKELKELTAAEAEREAQKKQQKTTEAEAGKLIQELITDSAEGAEEIQRRTVQAFAERSKAQSVTISGIDTEIKQQKELLATEKDPDRIRMAQMRIEELRAQRTQAGTMIEQQAGTQYGDLLAKAKTGHGAEQARAREDLSTLIGQAGFGGLAADIAGTTPEALGATDQADKEFERRMDAAKVAGQKRRATAAAAAQKARAATAEAKRTQADIDRHTDAWAKEGEDFIADRERAAKAAPRLAKQKAQEQQEAQTTALAQNIQRMSRPMEGFQFTPAQAKAAAEQAMKAMEHQIDADQAILMAMDGVLNAMAKAGHRFAGVQMQAVRAARQANGMGDFFDQKQPGAGNVGGN